MRPEDKIKADFRAYVEARGWFTRSTHGNAYQTGFPDVYMHHRKWGQRWVDLKVPGKYSFTKAQKIEWPLWEQAGIGIWIITGANQSEYDKLFGPPNWRQYWKASWGVLPDVNKLLEELNKGANHA